MSRSWRVQGALTERCYAPETTRDERGQDPAASTVPEHAGTSASQGVQKSPEVTGRRWGLASPGCAGPASEHQSRWWTVDRFRRLRAWFLGGAKAICGALLAGMVHDFRLGDPASGWLTGRPVAVTVLLSAAFFLMFLYRPADRAGTSGEASGD
jgi:hypothetical protein